MDQVTAPPHLQLDNIQNRGLGFRVWGLGVHMSYNLNFSNWGDIGDYIGDCYRGH